VEGIAVSVPIAAATVGVLAGMVVMVAALMLLA